jgi:hypothetical protein
MSIAWNKVTWYSKILAVVLFVVVFYVGFNLGEKKKEINLSKIVTEKAKEKTTSVSITTKEIKEENFTGKVPVIAGSSALAVQAQAYINETVADFQKQANTDVPDMRKQFGADNPTAQYEIDIEAKYVTSSKTESIVLLVYTYTGGAHGNSLYKVLTASAVSGKILSLSDIIKKEEQKAFTLFVQKELNAWRPAGNSDSVVFPEDVQSLTFASFTNWSLDDKNLVIYFGQYDIGPGVLGPVAFPLPLSQIKNFLYE